MGRGYTDVHADLYRRYAADVHYVLRVDWRCGVCVYDLDFYSWHRWAPLRGEEEPLPECECYRFAWARR
jgi:hypothetical protein